MLMSFRHIRTVSARTLTAALLWSGVAMAAEKRNADTPKSEAVRSLENVLQKAGEQGFVAIEGQAKRHDVRRAKPNKAKPGMQHPEKYGTINCNIAAVLDLSIYQSVTSFEDISLVKSEFESSRTLDDVMPLVKTYMALGLGAETASLVRKFKGHEARLIESMGRLIDGYPLLTDQKTITQYANCNAATKFWALFVKTSETLTGTHSEPFELSHEEQKFLEELPPQLKNLVTLRLGIYAAEQKSETLADRILTSLAPKTKYGKLPAVKDDALLYYFAVVQQMKGEPAAHQIFKHLAQYDGLYRSRSLQRLAEENLYHGTTLYENFSDDLEAVSQQYNGQAESRQAALQVVKYRLQVDQFIDAIELSKRELALIDAERAEAVTFVAERIQIRLRDELKSHQIHALNAYVHDPLFFSRYEGIEALKAQTQKTAIDLNLPELVPIIAPKTHTLSEDEKKFVTYANARLTAKHGEYDRAIDIAKPYKADPEFQALILDAAIKSGNGKQAIEVLRHRPADAVRFEQQADMAWRKGHWGEAKIALEALAHKNPDKAVANKIGITNYVGVESRAYVDRAVPDTGAELDLLKSQLDYDIALVKGYLSDG